MHWSWHLQPKWGLDATYSVTAAFYTPPATYNLSMHVLNTLIDTLQQIKIPSFTPSQGFISLRMPLYGSTACCEPSLFTKSCTFCMPFLAHNFVVSSYSLAALHCGNMACRVHIHTTMQWELLPQNQITGKAALHRPILHACVCVFFYVEPLLLIITGMPAALPCGGHERHWSPCLVLFVCSASSHIQLGTSNHTFFFYLGYQLICL